MKISSGDVVIACLGSSSTAGKGQAFDWIGHLRSQPRNSRYSFRNFGVGGDFACNALQRVPAIVVCRPRSVVLWIGSNDVLAMVSQKFRWLFQRLKRMQLPPSLERFQETLHTIVCRLREETSATIGLCSLPPIGEDLFSANRFQGEINRHVDEFSRAIREIALTDNVCYIPLYEAMAQQIRVTPGRAFTSFRFFPFYRDAFRTIVLRQSPDEVADKNGWRLHTDGIHLNSRGGLIAAGLVQEFIDNAVEREVKVGTRG